MIGNKQTLRSGILGWLSFLLILAAACSGNKNESRAVILIIIDTLRADHLGSYGYRQAVTPNLDALAARGTQFNRAITPVPVTLAAVASLLTGRLPFHHGVRDNEHYILGPEEETLTERFQNAGWRTGAVLGSAILARDRGLAQGFEVYDDDFTGPYPVYEPTQKMFSDEFATNRRRADVVTRQALALLDRFKNDPYFLLVHYFDVHSYYDPPPRWRRDHPRRPYDGEVSAVDEQIGRLLVHAGKNRDPLIVVVSDHGEGMTEHHESEHGFLLYQSTLQVPVIVAGPGIPVGKTRSDLISLIDLEPTLGAWLDLPGGGRARDGRSLIWDQLPTETVPMYAETMRTLVSYSWAELRSIQEGDWKLIQGPTSELFNLAQDPKELNDLGDVDPAPRLRAHLESLTGGETRGEVLAALRNDTDTDRKELIESLGYLSGETSEPAKEKDYPHPKDQLPKWLRGQKDKAYYRKGVTLAMRGQYVEAIVIFDSVLTKTPNRIDAIFNRGLSKQKLGDEAGFLADLKRTRELDDSYVPALAVTAHLDQQAGRKELAHERWLRVQELEPNRTDALNALSEWHLKREEWKEALPFLRSLVSELPQNASARLNLGLAAAHSGRVQEARTHLETFLRLDPGHERISQVQDMLMKLPKS